MKGVVALRAIPIGLAAALAAAVLATAAAEPARMDFVSQYAAARLVLEGRGAAVLDPAAVLAAERAAAPSRAALLPFVQVPAVALLLAPLAVLPFEAAFGAVAVIDALLLTLALRLLRHGDGWSRALLLVAPPSAIALAQGQLTPLALLLTVVALRAGPRAAGLSLGLTLLRPQTAPLLVLAGLLDPARRAWTVAGALIVVALSALVVGVDGVLRYGALLADASRWTVTGELGVRGSIGWSGLALLAGVPWAGLALPAICLVVGAIALARTPSRAAPATAALWSLLAAPHVLLHDAVLAYPAVLALSSPRRPWDVGSALAWIGHVLVVPAGALWTLALAVGSWPNARSSR